MNLAKKKLLVNAFFSSQFSYCPLVWMFHSRKLNNKINFLHERCLRLIYDDKVSTFSDLLKKNNSVCFHHRNIQILATEMYKVKNNLQFSYMKFFRQILKILKAALLRLLKAEQSKKLNMDLNHYRF